MTTPNKLTKEHIFELYQQITTKMWYILPQDFMTASLFLTYCSTIFFGLMFALDVRYLILIVVMFLNIYNLNCYHYGHCNTTYYIIFTVSIITILGLLIYIFYNKYQEDKNNNAPTNNPIMDYFNKFINKTPDNIPPASVPPASVPPVTQPASAPSVSIPVNATVK